MDLFVFQHAKWAKMYNCSMRNDQEWYGYGRPNVGMGIYCLGIGSLYMACSLPCLWVMVTCSQLRLYSSYKIMAFLTTLQALSLIINCFITGIMFLKGAVFCNYPHLLYFAGAAMFGLWEAISFTCVILSLTRLLDFWELHCFSIFYQGGRVFFWFIPPIIVGLFFFCNSYPSVFNSAQLNWLTDPYSSMPDIPHDPDLYNSPEGVYSNIPFVISTGFLNLLIILSVLWKTRESRSTNLSKLQRSVTIQALVVCSLDCITSFTYEYMNYVPPSDALILFSLVVYQASCGVGGIIYLVFNRTIRIHLKNTLLTITKNRNAVLVVPSTSIQSENTKNF